MLNTSPAAIYKYVLVVGFVTGSLAAVAPAAASSMPSTQTLVGVMQGSPSSGDASYSGDAVNTSAAETGLLSATSSRTILQLDQLHLTPEDTLTVQTPTTDSIVILEVAGSATVAGKLQSNGNVWISAPQGVTFGATSAVNSRGLLATTASIADTDFLDDDTFSFFSTPASATVSQTGGSITGSGLIGLLAPVVEQSSTAVIGPGSAAAPTPDEVLLGSVTDFTLQLDSSSGRLAALTHHPVEMASSIAQIVELFGSTTAENIYTTSAATTDSSYHDTHGTLNATGTVASGEGDVVLAAGQGLQRTAQGVRPTTDAGDPQWSRWWGQVTASRDVVGVSTDFLRIYGTVTAGRQLLLQATESVELREDTNAGQVADLTGPVVVFNTQGGVYNTAGADAVTASDKWVVYMPSPGELIPGLNSPHPAYWGSTLTSRPPSSITGDRFVFSQQNPLTFVANTYETDFDEPNPEPPTYVVLGLSPGIAGMFTAATSDTAYLGEPSLTSAGLSGTAKEGEYPLTIDTGTLTSLDGSTFTFEHAEVFVDDTTPPELTPQVTGTLGDNGWYTSDVEVSWTITEPGSDVIAGPGCGTTRITQDTDDTSIECALESGGGTASDNLNIRRDATAPVLSGMPADITRSSPDGEPVKITWTDPVATDAHLVVPDPICDEASGGFHPVGQTTVTCSATDEAGNRTTKTFAITVSDAPDAQVTFHRPIDAGGVINVAKLGRVVPVKLSLVVDDQLVTSTSPYAVHIGGVTQVSCAAGEGSDSVENYASPLDGGNLFRWDASGNHWIHNFDTGKIGARANGCYRITINYGGTVTSGVASGGTPVGSFLLKTTK